MRCLATHVVLLALAPLQPAFSRAALVRRSSESRRKNDDSRRRRHLRRRYLPSDLDDARETDDTIEWDDTTIEDDTRAVGPRWRRRPYGVIDDDGWAGDGAPVDPGAELALVLFLVIVIFWLAVGSAFAPRQRYSGATLYGETYDYYSEPSFYYGSSYAYEPAYVVPRRSGWGWGWGSSWGGGRHHRGGRERVERHRHVERHHHTERHHHGGGGGHHGGHHHGR